MTRDVIAWLGSLAAEMPPPRITAPIAGPSPRWTVARYAAWFARRQRRALVVQALQGPGVIVVEPDRVLIDPRASHVTLEANTRGPLLERPEDRRR